MENKETCFLQQFFETSKEKMKSNNIKICIGSEACDPDSFVSSLAIALHEKCVMAVNMSRVVFESKKEMMLLCKMFSISLDDLVFVERPRGKFPLKIRIQGTLLRLGKEEYKLSEKILTLIIVDHHIPIEELRHFELDMIIDHHPLSDKSLFAKRIYCDVEMGSCCTLISKFIGHSLLSSKESKNEYFQNEGICANLAKMLAIPIVFDTNNFQKVTSHFDKGEYKRLVKIASKDQKVVKKEIKGEIKEVVKKMKSARKDVAQLDNELILMQDFKKIDHQGFIFGYSTIKYPFEQWVDREAKRKCDNNEKKAGIYLEIALSDFRREHGLDFLIVNFKHKNKRFLILINCPIESMLVKSKKFESLNYKSLPYYKVEVPYTRKVIVPIMKKLLDKISEKDKQ